jgi:apolipoprotein D and lipocalin family protein
LKSIRARGSRTIATGNDFGKAGVDDRAGFRLQLSILLAPYAISEPATMRLLRQLLLCLPLLLLAACTSVPEGITPVRHFQLDRYLGKWYEIARIDHSFERGLSDVSAQYRLQPDGSVEVVNRGYSAEKGAWKEAVGKALMLGDATQGSLKVSFFGPFYGGYHIAALDEQEYRWSLVVGPSRDYLWILSRERHLPPAVREQLLAKATQLGFDISRLIWVGQDRPDA